MVTVIIGKSPTPGTERDFVNSFWFKYLLSVLSATVAESVTYPLDLTKTRLQIQGESASCRGHAHRGMLRTALGIVQEEGLFHLWRGITPAIYRHVIYTGIRFGAYEQLRDNLFHKNPDGTFPLWKAAICGMSAGALGQFVASPADLVKVQLQMEGRRRFLGEPPRVVNAGHAFRQILAQGGVKALWRGWVPNVQRGALVNLGDLTTYDTAKHLILKHTSLPESPIVHIMSSMCAGLVGATMATPVDVIKTRMMNQPTDASGKALYYRSSVECLIRTVKLEGFWALYKGFLPTWIRMGPWSLTFWLSYEQFRRLTGTHSF